MESNYIIFLTSPQLVKESFSRDQLGGHGRYPVGALVIRVPSDTVDVNLEPNKHRVGLGDEASCFDFILV